MVKTILFATGAAIVGNMIANRYVLRATPDSPSGFVDVTPGFGMDEVAAGLCVAGVFILGKKLLGGL